MNKKAILIVLYDKEICESTTIESLSELALTETKIVIHNNGPREISLPKEQAKIFNIKGIDFELINSIENKPLSVIYNEFINANLDCELFSIFDDDSYVSSDFVTIISNDSFDIELPKIMSRVDSKVYYPKVDKCIFYEDGSIIGSDVFSIGSGLTISNNVVKKFIKHKMDLFDEHYALYGVDFSFFRRLKKPQNKGEDFKISSNFTLLHSLSKAEVIQSKFRHDERLIDFALTVRHYPSPRLYLSFFKRIAMDLLRFNIGDIALVTKTYLTASHPRCQNK